MTQSERKEESRGSRRRGILFRLGAVLVGLGPLVLAELVCVWMGWGGPDLAEDPFVGFSSLSRLFVLSEDGERFEIPRARQVFFQYESFPAVKADDEFRIFCLGGSTVQGRPFGAETAFPTWLELSLGAVDPQRRRWRVVNCGGVSYASYRLVPILRETLRYDPDLVILYTGHNEFLEDRTYEHIKEMPGMVAGPLAWLARLRLFVLARRAMLEMSGLSNEDALVERPILPKETETILDTHGGFEQYHRDEEWRSDVVAHFRYNLNRMAELARAAGVPILFVNPGCNLRNIAPFKSEHRDGLTDAQLTRWDALRKEARALYQSDLRGSVGLFLGAIEIDDQYAGVFYQLAKCYDELGMTEEALEAYSMAKELDVCPLRVIDDLNGALIDVADRNGIPLVDIRAMFRERSRDGIPGNEFYIDHVHPTVHGHQLIAERLLEEMIDLEFVRPDGDWERRRDEAYQGHRGSLDELYYAKGMVRLERLERWTRGQEREDTAPSPLTPADSSSEERTNEETLNMEQGTNREGKCLERKMNNRERVIKTLRCEETDRAPFVMWLGFAGWQQTLRRWEVESGIAHLDNEVIREMFGFEQLSQIVHVEYGAFPHFQGRVLSETESYVTSVDYRGIVMKNLRDRSSMPEFLDRPVKTADDWERYKEERLQPRIEERLEGLDSWIEGVEERDAPVQVLRYPWGVFGTVRDLMGTEEILVGFYDRPEMIRDMMRTLVDLWLALLEAIDDKIPIDRIHIWEDMAYKGGSMISMAMVEDFMMPEYDRIVAFARRRNVPVVSADSDGLIDQLVPTMMAHGVQAYLPFEVQCGNDILEYRRKYPKLGIIGGLDKSALAKTKTEIHAELDRAEKMLAKGGYVAGFDHLIPPDVPWDNFKYAVEELRKMIGV